jgi:hypothetical protein
MKQKVLFRTILNLPSFEKGMNLKSGVKDAGETDENHEAGRKEVHDKFKGILQEKRADQRLDAESEEKNCKKRNQYIFPPPEA